jgi:hypothetical protein
MKIHDIELDSGRSLRLLVPPQGCEHLDQIHEVTPSSSGCEECLQIGDDWVHLRLCRSCGHVGCCDNSKNRHATKHHHQTGHDIIQTFEAGEDWMYCYVDDVFMEPVA